MKSKYFGFIILLATFATASFGSNRIFLNKSANHLVVTDENGMSLLEGTVGDQILIREGNYSNKVAELETSPNDHVFINLNTGEITTPDQLRRTWSSLVDEKDRIVLDISGGERAFVDLIYKDIYFRPNPSKPIAWLFRGIFGRSERTKFSNYLSDNTDIPKRLIAFLGNPPVIVMALFIIIPILVFRKRIFLKKASASSNKQKEVEQLAAGNLR